MAKQLPKDEKKRIAEEILHGLITDRYRVSLLEGETRAAERFDARIADVEAEIKSLA